MNNKFNYRMFGRSKGRSKKNKFIYDLNSFNIKKIDPLYYNVIDIGSGYGESTLEIAKRDTNKIVIACEKYQDGLYNIIEKKLINSLNNIFIFNGNAHQFLDEYCPENSISEIWILFPDPWPKKRHYKRRLINLSFFKKINKYLKEGAIIHIASDSNSYICHILNTAYKIKNNYKWINQNKDEWDYANLSMPKTKYFQKALEKGCNPFYLKLMKL